MRRTRTLAGIGIAAVALLALTACNSGTPSSSGAPEDGGEEETSGTPWTVLEDVSIDGSPTFDPDLVLGTIKVGVKEDQPGLGYLDPVTGDRTGFDVDIARWMAASLGVDPETIEFTGDRHGEPRAGDRERRHRLLRRHLLDHRQAQEQISFAGPYF